MADSTLSASAPRQTIPQGLAGQNQPPDERPDLDQTAPDNPPETGANLNARTAPDDPDDAAKLVDAENERARREREDREAEQDQAPQPVDGETQDPADVEPEYSDEDAAAARDHELDDREAALNDREKALDDRDQKNTQVHVSRLDQKHIDQLPVAEYYISGIDAYGAQPNIDDHARRALSRLTICVLVTRSGYPVVGSALSENPEDYDATMGRKLSRQDAMHQLWPLERYAVQGKLAGI